MSRHKPHAPHKFEGTPNPALDGIKSHVRDNGGWSARSWIKRATPQRPPLEEAPSVKVFAVQHGDRRFAVRAPTLEGAMQRLTVLLTD